MRNPPPLVVVAGGWIGPDWTTPTVFPSTLIHPPSNGVTMFPGNDQLVACPHCARPARHSTLLSGNTIGVRIWTDGKQLAPMSPETPPIAICLGCEKPFWLSLAKKLGQLDLDSGEDGIIDINPDWMDAEHVEEPTCDEYHRAIHSGFAKTVDEERTIRILAWWRENDPHRDDSPSISLQTATGNRRKNLEALLHLLGETNLGEQMMRAEILRHLGEFDQSRTLLSKMENSPFAPVIRQLRILCDARDVSVRELFLVAD